MAKSFRIYMFTSFGISSFVIIEEMAFVLSLVQKDTECWNSHCTYIKLKYHSSRCFRLEFKLTSKFGEG